MLQTFLTSADVGEVLGVTTSAVRLMLAEGRLKPKAVTRGGINLYTAKDVAKVYNARLKRLAAAEGLTSAAYLRAYGPLGSRRA